MAKSKQDMQTDRIKCQAHMQRSQNKKKKIESRILLSKWLQMHIDNSNRWSFKTYVRGALRVFFFHLLVNTLRLKENAGYRRKQTNSSAVIGVLLGNEAFVDFCLQLPVQIRDRNSINM